MASDDVPQTVYREGDRIRASDGIGYIDHVDDDTIHDHMRRNPRDARYLAFARAVLAIREYERVSS